ncbi:MAG: site-specific integrase [Hespellia sp.]|nr:site-specific integrase [Hespellia sp.]
MWVEQLDNGKFKFVERYTHPLTGKSKKVSVTLEKDTSQTQKLAQKTLDKRIEKILDKITTSTKEYTLSELVEAYRANQLASVEYATYRRNYFACNTIMKLLGKDILVDRLTGKYITDRYRTSGKKPGTVNESMERFRALIRWGYENDMISDIKFLDKVKNFKDDPHRVKIEDKFLEGNELKAVLADMKHECWKLLTEFFALSGLRFAELSALEDKDVDLNHNVMHITKGYDSVNRLDSKTKNSASYDDVHIQPELAHVCRQIRVYMMRCRLCFGVKSKLFFHDNDGGHVHYYAYNKYLKTHAMKITGKLITAHALRHTHASLLFEQGFSIDEVARRLRHGDSRITRQIYVHVTKKLKEKDGAKLDAINIL